MEPLTDIYRGWTIAVTANESMCANYSFTITSPTGYSQHVAMGGENRHRATERAREMIDMEISFLEDE